LPFATMPSRHAFFSGSSWASPLFPPLPLFFRGFSGQIYDVDLFSPFIIGQRLLFCLPPLIRIFQSVRRIVGPSGRPSLRVTDLFSSSFVPFLRVDYSLFFFLIFAPSRLFTPFPIYSFLSPCVVDFPFFSPRLPPPVLRKRQVPSPPYY